MPAEGRENPLLKKGNSDAFFREKYLTKNRTWQFDTAKKLIDRIAGNGWRVPHDIIPAEYKGA